MFITLLELDRVKPYSKTYKFKVQVFDVNYDFLDILLKKRDEQDFEIIAEEKEEIRVTIEAPDDQGYLWINFSNHIRLPANCNEWTYNNEGR